MNHYVTASLSVLYFGKESTITGKNTNLFLLHKYMGPLQYFKHILNSLQNHYSQYHWNGNSFIILHCIWGSFSKKILSISHEKKLSFSFVIFFFFRFFVGSFSFPFFFFWQWQNVVLVRPPTSLLYSLFFRLFVYEKVVCNLSQKRVYGFHLKCIFNRRPKQFLHRSGESTSPHKKEKQIKSNLINETKQYAIFEWER